MKKIDWLRPTTTVLGAKGYDIYDAMRNYMNVVITGENIGGVVVFNRVGEVLKFAVLMSIGSNDDDQDVGELIWVGHGDSGLKKGFGDSYFGDKGLVKDLDMRFMAKASNVINLFFDNGVHHGD